MCTSRLLVLLLALPLAGCLQSRVEDRGVGSYRLNAPYETREELQAALAENQRLAEELCPSGWYKSKDFDRTEGGSRVLVWEIACDRQFRPDNVRKKVN